MTARGWALVIILALALFGLLYGLPAALALIGTTNQPPCYAHVQGFRLPPGGRWC